MPNSNLFSAAGFGDEALVAAFLKKSKRTLQTWRRQGIGPPYYKVGGHILYDLEDIHVWLKAQRHHGNNPKPATYIQDNRST